MPAVDLVPVPVEEALTMSAEDRWEWIMETYSMGQGIDLRGKLTAQQLEEIGEIGKHDLFFFSTVILGYARLGLTGFHFDMCKFIEDGAQACRDGSEWHGFINVPREHFKTTIAVIARGLQRIVEIPWNCQLITSATAKLASSTASVMKWHIENNEVLRRFYPNIVPDRERWATSEFRVKIPKGMPYRREPTVMSIGVGGTPESYHFDYLSQDDLCTRKNSMTRTGKKNVIEFYGMAQALLNEGGEEIITGTRFADDELYGWILSDESDTMVEVFPLNAVETEGVFIFPEEWDEVRLSQKRSKMRVSDFFCQYYNDTTPRELQQFTEEMFKYCSAAEMPEITVYIGVDSSTGLGADPSGIVIVGIDRAGVVYVLHFIRRKLKWGELIELVDELVLEYQVVNVKFETYGQAKSILASVEDFQSRFDRYWSYEGCGGSKSQKVFRIVTALQPLYNAGRVVHDKVGIRGSEYEYQLLKCGVTSADDLADAAYLAITAAREGGFIGASRHPVKIPKTIAEKVEAGVLVADDELLGAGPTIETAGAFERSMDW